MKVSLVLKEGGHAEVSLLVEHGSHCVELVYVCERGIFSFTEEEAQDAQEGMDRLVINVYEMDEKHAPRYFSMYLMSYGDDLSEMVGFVTKLLEFLKTCQEIARHGGVDAVKQNFGLAGSSRVFEVSREMMGLKPDDGENGEPGCK